MTGLEDAIARAHRYAAAGADVIFVDAPRSEDELRAIGVGGHRQAAAREHLGVRADAGSRRGRRFEALGFSIALYPTSTLFAASQSTKELAASPARERIDALDRAADDAVRRAQRDPRQGRMGRDSVSANESIFTVAGTPLVFGPGAALETGWHLRAGGRDAARSSSPTRISPRSA